jgi:hypothetical protein
MSRCLRHLAGLAVLLTATTAAAASPPCAGQAEPYRDFDFWIGAWTVTDPDSGARLGRNVITRTQEGCLLLEDWSGASGSRGFSMNFVDPATGRWRQVWHSPGFTIDLEGGLDDTGAMALEGSIVYQADGRQAEFRGRWTPHSDGSVTQSFLERAPGGDWTPWFTGLYQPAPSPAD